MLRTQEQRKVVTSNLSKSIHLNKDHKRALTN